MFDLILRGGEIVDPDAIRLGDLGLSDGKIAARLRPGEPATANSVLDVQGRLLLPGLVDAHVHLREPGMTWKEDIASGTRAALAGGVTTVLVMPTDDPWTADLATFEAKAALAKSRAHVDLGLQVAVANPPTDLLALGAAGAVSFEIFTADVPTDYLHRDAQALTRALAAVANIGGIAAVSPGDQSLLDAELRRLTPGRSTAADFVRSRPAQGEAQGIACAIIAAAELGSRLHLRQSNSAAGLAVFRRLRDLADVTIETSPQCLLFTSDDYDRLGPLAKASPPLRGATDRGLWRVALAEGLVDIVVTDHAPHLASEKLDLSHDFAAIPGGFPGVQTLLPTLLSLVAEGVIGLCDLVRVAAARPAERFGLGRSKGRLAPGCDADLIVLDPTRTSVVRDEDQLSRPGFTPFAGLEVPFALERVFLRGEQALGPEGIAATSRGRLVRPGD